MIAQAVANTGWTWDQALDNLTVPRLLALQAEWRTNPPAHWLLAAALKYRPPDASATRGTRQASVADLKAALPGGALAGAP